MQACDRCHSRKTKCTDHKQSCDRQLPRCGSCQKAGVECLHTDKLQQRNYPRGYLEDLEKRLRGLEHENQRLRKQLMSTRRDSQLHNSQPMDDIVVAQTLQSPDSTQFDGKQSIDVDSSTPPKPAGGNLVADEVERLSMRAATGESRYLGSSSGVEFAQIVQSIVDSANLREGLFPADRGEEQRNPPIAFVPKDAPIPSKEIATPFIDSYMNHWHISFPLLHRPSFLKVAERIFNDGEYYRQNPFDAFCFDMVLAMGSANRLEWSVTGTESYFSRAMNKLDRILGMKGIMPLQALLFTCQYGVFASLRDTSSNIWHLLGIAARFCIEQGLHRESSMVSHSSRGNHDKPAQFESEMRRRCFWCFYNLDRVVSVTLGRPLALRDEDVDVDLPTFDDDELENGDGSPRSQANPDKISRIAPFVHLIRMRALSGKIKQALYSTGLSRSLSLEEKLAIRDGLRSELETWRADTAKLALPQRSKDAVPSSTFLSNVWYNVIFHNAMLLLYRPSPLLPYTGRKPSEMDATDAEALQVLLRSAEESVNGYADLLRKRRLNYSWITLYSVFMSGLAYVYGVGRAIRARRWRDGEITVPPYIDVINVTRNCSNTLVAVCERWNDARSSCEIFDRLSSTAIQEAVKSETQDQNSIGRHPGADNQDHYQLPPFGSSTHGLNTLVTAATEGTAASQRYPPYSTCTETYQATSLTSASPMEPAQGPTSHFSLSPDFFQNYFQDLQDSIVYNDDFTAPNEVMLGFREEWFQRQ